MSQEEGMLQYEAGHYELNGYPLRPGGHMVRLSEGLTARFPRHYLREGWESEDLYDIAFLMEKWSKGALSDEQDNAPPRAPNGLAIMARNARGKILVRIMGTRTANKLQGAMTTAREILQTTPWAVRAEVHLYEGYESLYTGKPLAVFSSEDVSPENEEDEEDES
jgi:hypothetical protein